MLLSNKLSLPKILMCGTMSNCPLPSLAAGLKQRICAIIKDQFYVDMPVSRFEKRDSLGCFIFSTFLILNTFGLICDGISDTDSSGKIFCHCDVVARVLFLLGMT